MCIKECLKSLTSTWKKWEQKQKGCNIADIARLYSSVINVYGFMCATDLRVDNLPAVLVNSSATRASLAYILF